MDGLGCNSKMPSGYVEMGSAKPNGIGLGKVCKKLHKGILPVQWLEDQGQGVYISLINEKG